jgi:hypothetical protein
MPKRDSDDDSQFANQGYEPKELDAGYSPIEEESNLEARLPDPPSGGTGEQGKDSDEE